MTQRTVHRPGRMTSPLEHPPASRMSPPPQLGDAPPGGFPLQSMLPILGSLSSITMIVVLRSNPLMVAIGGMILVVALVGGLGMAFSQRGRAVRARRRDRERYLDYLERVRTELAKAGEDARAAATMLHPDPLALPELVADPERLWERRRRDSDFLHARIGAGESPWASLALPDDPNPVNPFDPLMAREAIEVGVSAGSVSGMPLWLTLVPGAEVALIGVPGVVHATARALVGQLAAFHAPEDLQLAFAIPEDRLDEWDGAGLLPHTVMTGAWDGPLPARRLAPSLHALGEVLGGELVDRLARSSARHSGSPVPLAPLVVVVDNVARAGRIALPDGASSLAQLGVIMIHLVGDRRDEPSDVTTRVTLADSMRIAEVRGDTSEVSGIADRMSSRTFFGLASALAPLRLSAASKAEAGTVRDIGPFELLGSDSIDAVTPARWGRLQQSQLLRVPVGSDDDGAVVHLDLKEAAQEGMGPHGICIGATGSGKSEFLRTLILALTATHSPEDLAMILVDFKGGAAFEPFSRLPHVAGLIDNLADDAQLTERARASIAGEVVRRQRQLKDAGSMASITEYRAARAKNPLMPAMPHLLLVIDEFGELLTAEPEFIDLLLTIGRIGRSIGVHMLLSSQRIESGKLKGLDSYLSYRIGLRTFSEQESAVVLNTPDAFHLPSAPGYGYLKVDTSIYTRFKAGYVSGSIPAPTMATESTEAPRPAVYTPYNQMGEVFAAAVERAGIGVAPASEVSLLSQAVAQLSEGTATDPVWLEPLPDRLPLLRILDRSSRSPLTIPLGLVDDPARQRQTAWELDLTRAGGHFAIIGAPQSGRSTLLRTLAAAAASTMTPRDVSLYGLDLTGAGLARLEAFPHVGGVATRNNPEQQTRLLEELARMLDLREKIFLDRGIESLVQFRAQHAENPFPGVTSPDVVLLVDGYGLVRTDFEHLDAPLADLLSRGGSYGIHLVLALTRWNDLRMNTQPLIGNRIELRLNDPGESTIGRKLSASIRQNQPGRAITEDALFAQVALPTVEEVDDANLGEALTELAQQVAASWNGPSASPIRLLPESLDPDTLPDEIDEPDWLPLGLRQDTMEPALLELGGRDQHLLVLGDTQSGKTTVLRQIMHEAIARKTPDEIVIALMEPRGTLAAECPDDYLGGHATSGAKARELSAALALELDKRQNGQSSSDLAIVVLVDDYDILSAGGVSPLDALLPFLPSARDLGLNVVLTRPVAGASRAIFDPAIQTLRETGASGLVLSGERSEGALWPGVHASPAPAGRAKFIRRGDRVRLLQVAHRTEQHS